MVADPFSSPGAAVAGADVRTALMIARRYLFARSHGYATLINWVSFIGLALGVTILTVVVSVMNGFDREITTRILSVVPHGIVARPGLRTAGIDAVRAIDGVDQVSRYFEGEAMLARSGAVNFIVLAAFDEDGLESLSQWLGEDAIERLLATPGGIALGAPLARAMGIDIGDPVALVLSTLSGAGVRPRIERFELVGIFETEAEPDAALGVALRADIVRRGLTAAGTDGWRLHLADPFAAPALAVRVREALGAEAEVRFWMEDHGELFRAVKIEKAIMFALLALIVAIAAFNIVSGQAMLVNDKRGDVAMLATMGASRRLLVAVFFLQGFSVAFLGVAAGLAAGVLLATYADEVASVFEAVMGASIIEGTWFTEIPSQVLASDLAIITGLSLGLSLLAVLWPALKATAQNPAQALHSA